MLALASISGVRLGHDYRRHQPHLIGPRRQSAHQGQGFRVVEGHPLAPTQRREGAAVDRTRPGPQHLGIQVRSMIGMVIAICTTAILARGPLDAAGCRRGSIS
jgi:hypothetical protein